MKLLIATTNQGKMGEYQRLLRAAPFELVLLSDLGITEEPEETGATLEENAILKARFYAEKSGIPTLADDTGLEIDALGGEPGIHARRWPGYKAGDEELVAYAISRMKGIPEGKRTARFRAVLAVAKDPGDIRIFEGVLEGILAEKAYYPIVPGLPYRSLFCPKGSDRVLAESSMEELANLHREQAAQKAMPFLLAMAGEINMV
ncbi:MAG: non-canonical purine NTP pyrophosphatase [Candidatus Wildermuthbacteria bacterium]|nr:non-canonical purine NTP pyrophosphatase [Candidatus Wildermuthbacteria bacterium]